MVDSFILEHQLHVKGDYIPAGAENLFYSLPDSIPFRRKTGHDRKLALFGDNRRVKRDAVSSKNKSRAEHLLQVLPGFASGRMAHLAIGLKTRIA